jgi:hypothetical protein
MNISSQLRVRFCVLIIGLWIILPGLMEKGPSKLRAQELRLYRDRIEPNWFAGDSKFWYKLELPGNRREFWLVDPQQGMRQPAFDHEAVAAAWNLRDNSQVQPERLAIDSLEFSENDESVLLNLVNQGQLQWNPATQELTQIKPAPTAAVGKLFMPPVPSTDEGGTSELTVKNQLDGTIQVIWVDREGNEQVYSTTPQGESFQISTYRGHVWLIRREGGEAIGCFVAQGDETVIELTPTMADNVENNRPTDNARRRGNARTPNRRGGRAGMAGEMRSRSPNREWQAFVRDHNLWLSRAQESDAVDSNRERQFSQDATVDNSFRRDASRARLVSMRYDLTDFPTKCPM